jgi:hypothetical protein
MPSTYTLISSNVLATSAASVTFSAIPATFTDLVLRWSSRDSNSLTDLRVAIIFNNNSASYSYTYIYGNGSSAGSSQATNTFIRINGGSTGADATANTFSSSEMYIPNYAGTAYKPVFVIAMPETNAATFTGIGMTANAALYSNSTAISRIDLTASDSFVSGSSFYLYGIKNS